MKQPRCSAPTLVSIQVGQVREVVRAHGTTVTTGIFKTPVSGPVWAGALGLAGDAQADRVNHGGVHQAVYAYPAEHYDAWRPELGDLGTPGDPGDPGWGSFGENLTTAGLDEREVAIGDRLRLGGALLEVAQPRTPCHKLGLRLGRPDFPRAFLASLRCGFYLRVLEEGEIAAGDAIEVSPAAGDRMSVADVFALRHFRRDDRAGAARAAALPALSPGWREHFLAVCRPPRAD